MVEDPQDRWVVARLPLYSTSRILKIVKADPECSDLPLLLGWRHFSVFCRKLQPGWSCDFGASPRLIYCPRRGSTAAAAARRPVFITGKRLLKCGSFPSAPDRFIEK